MEPLVESGAFTKYLAGDVDIYLQAATAAIRRYCGWHVTPAVNEVIVVDGPGSASLYLPTLHIVDIDDVTSEGTVLGSGDYTWTERGVLTRTQGWPTGDRAIQVRMTHGFEGDEAADVKGLAMSIAARARQAPAGVVRQQAGTMSVTPSQMQFNAAGGVGLLDWEKSQLDQYRIGHRP